MKITFLSSWRNSAHNVERYMKCVTQLKAAQSYPTDIEVIAVEGDSKDRTEATLVSQARAHSIPLRLVKCDHGGPRFGSTEDPRRMAALSLVLNAGMGAVDSSDDVVVYVESDLVWTIAPIILLVGAANSRAEGYDIFAPLIFAGDCFYDVWGFRKDGARFAPFYPYHQELNHNGLTEVDSVGSCFAARGEVMQKCRARNGNALVDWCADARSQNYRIAVDARLHINHP